MRWSAKHEQPSSKAVQGGVYTEGKNDDDLQRTSIPTSSCEERLATAQPLGSWESNVDSSIVDSAPTGVDLVSTGNSFEQLLGIWPDLNSSSRNIGDTSNVVGSSVAGSPPSIPPYLVDLPSTLVELWFKHVCPAWSTFDSDVNYNRMIAATTWSSSEPVFYTMQSMATTYLAECMPGLRTHLRTAVAKADHSIRQAVGHVRSSGGKHVDTGLIFAILGMGTSLHWTNGEVLHSWLDLATEVLNLWTSRRTVLETYFHAYFKQAIIYWRMLVCIASDIEHEDVEHRRTRRQSISQASAQDTPTNGLGRLVGRVNADQDFQGTRPNSWCGVSSDAIDLFGQVLALCRSARVESRYLNLPWESGLSAIAQDLQMELQSLDLHSPLLEDDLLGFSTDTGDDLTPTSHLLLTAEAYRQAALLQLHLTFPPGQGESDRSQRSSAGSNAINSAARALRLAKTLEQIPVDSGSRSIHPVLYLSAAAGLKFNTSIASDSATIDTATLEVAMARRLVLTRLSLLQHVLPSRPILCILDLVKAIWKEYDEAKEGPSEVHWIDVMMNTGLQTLFG